MAARVLRLMRPTALSLHCLRPAVKHRPFSSIKDAAIAEGDDPVMNESTITNGRWEGDPPQ